MSNTVEWNNSHRKIIRAPAKNRLYVSAGPGTGKISVACARVSQLIKDGVNPENICMVSFTHSSVRELRDQITEHLKHNSTAAGQVKIVTLDSLAGWFQTIYDQKTNSFATFDEKIEVLLERIKHNEKFIEYLKTLEHLIVDKDQNIAEARSDWIIKWMRRLPNSCGMTIFADNRERWLSIFEDIRQGSVGGEFQECELTEKPCIEWDDAQRAIISAPAKNRLYVSAGPGTGKTAVACARVSLLIQGGTKPESIWMISFTRAAVGEIRNQIAYHTKDETLARSVNIATLDRYAWSIHKGYGAKDGILKSYDENIKKVLELIQHNEQVAEDLEKTQHLIVDEAQDFVGIRCKFIIKFIRRLRDSCGVTIFADEAQAIYDFVDNKKGVPSISERIRRGDAGEFQVRELRTIHRTDSPELQKLYRKIRRKVFNSKLDGFDKYSKIRDKINELAHGKAPFQVMTIQPTTLILYRRKCEVLLRSGFLLQEGTRHRVRMSGLPVNLAPWIGAALSEHIDTNLTQRTFEKLWSKRVHGTHLETCDVKNAWETLNRFGGLSSTVLDMCLLRKRLGSKQPPVELCTPWFGDDGPLVSTIHASKGQEAEEVYLMLPTTQSGSTNWDEESRILLVGATRARSKLLLGGGFKQYASSIKPYGRVYSLKTKYNKPRAQVTIGLKEDIDAEGLASYECFLDDEEVCEAQKFFRQNKSWPLPVSTESDIQTEYRYRLKTQSGNERCLAVLTQNVNKDLFSIANAVQSKIGGGKRRPPDYIKYLHIYGVRTIVLPPDHPQADNLHEPWSSSGIMLAPQILGYSTVYFPFRRR